MATEEAAQYTSSYTAGNATATGPYMGSVTWGGASGATVDFNPPATIQFPAEVKVEEWELAPEVELTEKTWHMMRESIGRQYAEQIDNLMMNGPEPRKKEKKMPKNEERTLYNIFIIDPDGDGEVVATLENVVAKDVEAAKIKALYALAADKGKLAKDLEDYDLLVEVVADFGSIRPKKDK